MRNLAMKNFCVGIDVAKLSFVAAIKIDGKYKPKSFDNNKDGFWGLIDWLEQFSSNRYHLGLPEFVW